MPTFVFPKVESATKELRNGMSSQQEYKQDSDQQNSTEPELEETITLEDVLIEPDLKRTKAIMNFIESRECGARMPSKASGPPVHAFADTHSSSAKTRFPVSRPLSEELSGHTRLDGCLLEDQSRLDSQLKKLEAEYAECNRAWSTDSGGPDVVSFSLLLANGEVARIKKDVNTPEGAIIQEVKDHRRKERQVRSDCEITPVLNYDLNASGFW